MIQCINLHKSFGDVHAVAGIDCSIPAGRFVGLLGPNGAGKTTLLRLMIGLLDPTEGAVTYDGVPMSKDALALKKRIGVVSQHVNLDKELTVEENMIFIGKLYHLSSAEITRRTDELLELTGLNKVRNRSAKRLSGGMKRKLMIARALIHDPDYLFLDEPTVGIDVTARKEIWAFLSALHRQGKTFILTTHYIEEVEQLADWVMLIDEGRVFKEDTVLNLIAQVGMYKVEQFAETGSVCKFYPDRLTAEANVPNTDSGYTVTRTNLEDVFFNWTQKKVHIWK